MIYIVIVNYDYEPSIEIYGNLEKAKEQYDFYLTFVSSTVYLTEVKEEGNNND